MTHDLNGEEVFEKEQALNDKAIATAVAADVKAFDSQSSQQSKEELVNKSITPRITPVPKLHADLKNFASLKSAEATSIPKELRGLTLSYIDGDIDKTYLFSGNR